VDDHRATFEKNGVELKTNFSTGELYVDADPVRLVQAITNVLSNALKFTPRGGLVRVDLHRTGSTALIMILDTGIGRAPNVIAHLFEPFAQAPQTLDRHRGGLGLGLAIVKELIGLHGGNVEISSEGINHGSVVKIHLPLVEAPAVVAKNNMKEAVCVYRRVLIIEDNPDAANTLRDLLVVLGHEADVADDGAAGITKACVYQPDIVICDLGLPGMDGFDVARAFRSEEMFRSTYLVALSGYAAPADVRAALAAGFDHHCAKPLSAEALDRLLIKAGSRTGG
jgi:CheY-like chemotaxis protein